MNFLLRLIEHAFDFAFYLMHAFPPILVLAIFALFTAVAALLVFRRVSDQKAIRRAKDKIGAHVLEIRLFPDQLSVVARAYFAFLRSLADYLRHILRPVLILFVPLFFLFLQLDAYFAHTPLNAGQDFLVQTKLAAGEPLEKVALKLPEGIAMTAPPVHILPEREVIWRLRADRGGTFLLRLAANEGEYTKRIVVGGGMRRVNWDRERGGILVALISQDEPPLPAAGPILSIQVQYPDREITLWRWQVDWLVPFLGIMLISALLLKGFLRTEL
ncbi:MAG TPA: hypothetical protein VLX32_07340 [Candidatus Acidoferrum sp.]|nr:hypothetical protein [Candidatus Acidoferrum sp.]